MSSVAFWALIDRARSEAADPADLGEVAGRVVDVLAEQDPGFIVSADEAMRLEMALVRSRPLWGAAHLILGGCSDEGFDTFLGWLVGQGRATFQAAFADPDSLADLTDEVLTGWKDGEQIRAAPSTAYQRTTGEQLSGGGQLPRAELGEEWNFDDAHEMRSRYPRLWERFGG